MSKGWKSVWYVLENVCLTVNRLLRIILVRSQKEKRGAVEKVLNYSENTYIIPNRMWVEI